LAILSGIGFIPLSVDFLFQTLQAYLIKPIFHRIVPHSRSPVSWSAWVDNWIINAAVHLNLPDHVFSEEFSDRFTAVLIVLGLSLLHLIGSAFRLGLSRPIRMSGSSSISQRTLTANAPEPHLPGTTTSDSGQSNALRA
jgi:hypothetical protein